VEVEEMETAAVVVKTVEAIETVAVMVTMVAMTVKVAEMLKTAMMAESAEMVSHTNKMCVQMCWICLKSSSLWLFREAQLYQLYQSLIQRYNKMLANQ
jgi:hypothetical protein